MKIKFKNLKKIIKENVLKSTKDKKEYFNIQISYINGKQNNFLSYLTQKEIENFKNKIKKDNNVFKTKITKQ